MKTNDFHRYNNNDTRSCASGYRPEKKVRNVRPRYAQSDIMEAFIPKFSALSGEGGTRQQPIDDWADNTTVVTGVTSDSLYIAEKPNHVSSGRVIVRRCSHYVWIFFSAILIIFSVTSAPLMIIIPSFIPSLNIKTFANCDIDCEGMLFLMFVKTLFLILSISLLYSQRSTADMPRIYFTRVAIMFLIFFIIFSYWFFYVVRIILERYDNFKYIVSYSVSLLDALLWTHYLSVMLLEFRRLRTQFVVTIVRDPDGETRTMTIGTGSIQEISTEILKYYVSSFPAYNVYFDKARQMSTTKNMENQGNEAGFKMYKIEQFGGQESVSEINTRALMQAAARRRMGGYSEVLQEEMDFEKRLKKRRYRLIAAAEDAFSHVQANNGNSFKQKEGFNNQMDSLTAAQNVFTWIVRPLTKYLKTTRLQSFHPSDAVTRHIERCLLLKLSHRTFLQRFFSDRFPDKDYVSESKWTIICDQAVSKKISHGTYFVLKSLNEENDINVKLVCTISTIPFFNITEQSNSSNDKFSLRMNTESSV